MSVRDFISVATGGKRGGASSLSAKLATGLTLGALSAVAASPFDQARVRIQAEGERLRPQQQRDCGGEEGGEH